MSMEESRLMNEKYLKIKDLFLQQSGLDCWREYRRSLAADADAIWDYVILTASNKEQAEAYRLQIADRRIRKLLPPRTKFAIVPDPEGKRVGSGGATLCALKYVAEQDGPDRQDHFSGRRILIMHSGGDSRRAPQYSACGKLFSPVPRELPDGRPSILFDELMISMAGMAGRIAEGVLVLSGDVLLLFNPLQIACQFRGAAAISVKAPVSTGTKHGVFLNDGSNHVGRFLHKQPADRLRGAGAVNGRQQVDLDTGTVLLDANLSNALYSLISTEGRVDNEKFNEFVNDTVRINFYGDFLYPLARQSTWEEYMEEAPEGAFCEELLQCRSKIWNALHTFEMSLISLSPAEFIHFGTSLELRELMTRHVNDYASLGWSRFAASYASGAGSPAAHTSLILADASAGGDSYIENSWIDCGTAVGEGSIVSGLRLSGVAVPDNVVLHGLPLHADQFVVRVYGVQDNPKETRGASFLGGKLRDFMERNHILPEELWEGEERSLWYARLYPVCADREEALRWALLVCQMARGRASREDVAAWKAQRRLSLYSSFNCADVHAILSWKRDLENRIAVKRFVAQIAAGVHYQQALTVFGDTGINREQYAILMELARDADFSTKIRIYYDLSRYLERTGGTFEGTHYGELENRCFSEIRRVISEDGKRRLPGVGNSVIAKDEARISLPVRVNWGGGWSDTPPYCHERGGTVLNAAVTLRGICPVRASIQRIDRLCVEFESGDIPASGAVWSAAEIQDCRNPYDFFALHKAALIAVGIVPNQGPCDLSEVLRRLGGGFRLSTQVVGIPKGSGLGISSILSGACIKAFFEFFGQTLTDDSLYSLVLCMEQIMFTGGGWQDQVGGIAPGIKLITTRPGIEQRIHIEPVVPEPSAMEELRERLALIYTGQRRLARNLLRDVMGGYIAGQRESLDALEQIQRIAVLMKFELEHGNIDRFAELLNKHWLLSQQLDQGSTNTCINQIFLACEDLIDGRFIAGAGGGGFLQVILKKNCTKAQLQARLHDVFQASGVEVWDAEFI